MRLFSRSRTPSALRSTTTSSRRRSSRRPQRPPTEALLHVSVNALRRIGGLLRSQHEVLTDADRKTIARVDRFLGGDWWHPIALGATDEEGVATKVAEQLIGMYCQRVGKATGFGWVRSRSSIALISRPSTSWCCSPDTTTGCGGSTTRSRRPRSSGTSTGAGRPTRPSTTRPARPANGKPMPG